MRFLGSFNTKLDELELKDAIRRCGEGNAILTKKHRIFLIRPIVRMLFAFGAFGLLIWLAYIQFYKSENLIFRIITIAYSVVTFARCIHSIGMIVYDIHQQFDIKGYKDFVSDEDLKEGRYEIFLKHTSISIVLQVLMMIVNSIVSFYYDRGGGDILLNIIGIFVNIGFIFLLYKVLDRIIDYEMDFNIFTVDQFIIYRQHGFFKTESMNIATSTIKIVKESKNGFWGSLFHYGNLSIHPEGSLSDSKTIELFYVPFPKYLTKKLNEFIDKSKEGINQSVI